MALRLLVGDNRLLLREIASESVHCVVTSPPYFGLRNYGTATWMGGDLECDHQPLQDWVEDGGDARRSAHAVPANLAKAERRRGGRCHCGAIRVDQQIGMEATPEEFIAKLVDIFREVRRILRDDGTLWLNIGDSYSAAAKGSAKGQDKSGLTSTGTQEHAPVGVSKVGLPGIKPKDLIGIPWMLAFALRANGWVLRQELVWSKPNPMPESVRDRCTKAHEQIFLFSKARWSGSEPGRFADISDEDARWLALLIDTEGCIVVKRNQHAGRSDTFAPQVSVGNTSLALMEEVRRIIGHGNILQRPGKNAPMFYWQVANCLARDLLHRLYPHLIVKQRQARICIHLDSLTYFRGGKRPECKRRDESTTALLRSLWERNKSLNQFGDPDLSDVPEPSFGRWVAQPYFFDAAAIAEPVVRSWSGSEFHTGKTMEHQAGRASTKRSGNLERVPASARGVPLGKDGKSSGAVAGNVPWEGSERNKRSVWTVSPVAFGYEMCTACDAIYSAQEHSDLRSEPIIKAGKVTGRRVFCRCGEHAAWLSHFATFPPELIEPCILAGCPAQCCSACGAPVVRDIAKERRPNERPEGQRHDGTYYAANPGGGVANDRRARVDKGWRPSCKCAAPATRGTVLDPFFGAGTTGLVADRLQRDCIGTELNPRYAALARRRIADDRGGGLLDAMEAAE